MATMINDTRTMLQRSRSVADNADFLSMALVSGDQGQIENAVDDLLAAYDSYTGQAKNYSSRLGFDEMAQLADPVERDQSAANALAGALIDLEVAMVLGRVAQATGEIEGQVSAADLDEAVATLNETIKAIEGPSGAAPGMNRFAFDEVIGSERPETVSSLDVPTAKATYEKQVKTFYDTLLTETTALLVTAFNEISGLDANKISQGLKTIVGPIESLPGGRLAARVLEAIKRTIDTLKGILGPGFFGKIEEQINKRLDEIRKGGNLLQSFLKDAYAYNEGQKNIAGWLQISQADQAAIDQGMQTLDTLQQQVVQTFALGKRIVTTLRSLSGPLEWILKRFGGTLPLDILMGGTYLLVINIALLRGMDYADTTQIVKLVDGVIITSKRTLSIGKEVAP